VVAGRVGGGRLLRARVGGLSWYRNFVSVAAVRGCAAGHAGAVVDAVVDGF
jgi:hypothetical protein